MDLTISGRRLAYDVAGQGVPLVLLHAFPFDRRFFADAVGRMTRARAVVPDMRGFGDSTLDGPYALTDLADDVAHLLDHLQIERAVIAGVSMGGYVALAFAARHRPRLLGLVLADTKAGPDSPDARKGRDEAIARVRGGGVDGYLDGLLPRLLAPTADDGLRERARALAATQADALAAGLEAMRDRPDRRDELPRVPCPTLIVVGTDDLVTPPSEAAAMATAIPNAVLMELPGVGHLTNLEAPAPFAQAVAGFLGRTT
jgi:pimeloyl-ACP methyl ester carboxylesterase